MGLIGYFGTNRFEVSDSKILTFDDFQRDTAAQFESINRIGKKPLTEYIAPGLDTISFSIKANAMLGVNPRNVLDSWAQIATEGNPNILAVGNKIIGTDQWVLKSASESWEKIDGKGNVLESTITLGFEEYMSE